MIDSYRNKYQQKLDNFRLKLQNYLSIVLSKNRIPIIITMSRKMARVMDWLQVTGYIFIPKNTVVISEYALYYCLDDLINKHNGNVEVIIIDDLINTGASVEEVAACIMTYTQKKPKVLTLLNRNGSERYEYCELLTPNCIDSNSFVDYCVERNVENLMSIGMPLDMEFPIIEIKMPKGWSKNHDIESILKDAFPLCTVYGVTHGFEYKDSHRIITNYSVLFDKNKNNAYVSSDFSKIRFFVGDEKLTIEVYSPRTIEENSNIREIFFQDSILQGLWNVIVNNDKTDDSKKSNAFNHNKSLSEVVMLNYLYSFVFLTYNINNIRNVLKAIGIDEQCKVDNRNLSLLLSQDKAKRIAVELNSLLYSDYRLELDFDNLIFSLEDNEVSVDYKQTYEDNNTLRLHRSETVEDSMSTVFHNQGKLLLKGKYAYESFASIINKLSLHIKSDDMVERVHRCMDFMIDDASVTPAYVEKRKDGHLYWKRMFSAGDNTLLIDKLSCVIKYIFETYVKVSHKSAVETTEFSTVLSMVLNNCLCDVFEKNNGKLSIQHNVMYSHPVFNNVDSINILRYVSNIGYLDVVNVDGLECYQVASNDDSLIEPLLYDKEKQCIEDLLYFIWKYSKHEIFNLRYVMLDLNGEQYKDVAEKTKNYILDYIKDLQNIKNKEFNVRDFLFKIANILISIQQSNYIILKNELSQLDEDENDAVKDIWNKIYTKCPKVFDADYIELSSKIDVVMLLTTAIIDKFFFNDLNAVEEAFKLIKRVGLEIESFSNLFSSNNNITGLSIVLDKYIETIHNIFYSNERDI